MLETAIQAAQKAGQLLRENFEKTLQVNQAEFHDIKLQMDVDCQRLIESKISAAFPAHSIIGEEENYGDAQGEFRWIVDPLDGTVNYAYGIPHFCVSIALLQRSSAGPLGAVFDGYEPLIAVIYDPMRNELFSAQKGKGAFLNGRRLQVSQRAKFEEAIVSIGFSKTEDSIQRGLEYYSTLVRKVRKTRAMGSAALDLAYVAAGRLEMYLEFKVRLWDIAAGVLLVHEAGGGLELRPIAKQPHAFETLAWNGKLDMKLPSL